MTVRDTEMVAFVKETPAHLVSCLKAAIVLNNIYALKLNKEDGGSRAIYGNVDEFIDAVMFGYKTRIED